MSGGVSSKTRQSFHTNATCMRLICAQRTDSHSMAKLATFLLILSPYVGAGGATGERQGCAGLFESSGAREASMPEEQPEKRRHRMRSAWRFSAKRPATLQGHSCDLVAS